MTINIYIKEKQNEFEIISEYNGKSELMFRKHLFCSRQDAEDFLNDQFENTPFILIKTNDKFILEI